MSESGSSNAAAIDPVSIDAASSSAVRAHQQSLLARLRGEEQAIIYTVLGVEIEVWPGVFPPGGADTKLMLENLPIQPGTRLLELTTGSGVISVHAGLRGGHGLACDLNPRAVANARANFARHGVDFAAVESDGLSAVKDERYDLIALNPPYLDGEPADALEQAFLGATHLLEDVFQSAHSYLTPTGSLWITWAEWSAVPVTEIAARHGWQGETIARNVSEDGKRHYRLERWQRSER